MKIQLVALTAWILFVAPADAVDRKPGMAVIMGVSEFSCASWLKGTPDVRVVGDWLIAGLWSGMNIGNMEPGTYKGSVGWSTDRDGILGEVELLCRAEPSTQLFEATERVYRRFKANGR